MLENPLAIQSPPVFAQAYERSSEETTSDTGSWLTSIKNLLTGRVCVNWQSNLLIALTALHVVNSVICLFSGSWGLALLSVATAATCATLRGVLAKHASWEKKLNRMQKENSTHELNNCRQEDSIDELDRQVNSLMQARDSFKAEAEQYKQLNTQHESLLNTMGDQITRMTTALDEGRALSLEAAAEMRQNAQTLTAQVGNLPQELQDALGPKVAQFGALADKIGGLTEESIRRMNEAQANLEHRLQQLGNVNGQLTARNEELANTRQELERVKGELQEEVQKLQSAGQLNTLSAVAINQLLIQAGVQMPAGDRAETDQSGPMPNPWAANTSTAIAV